MAIRRMLLTAVAGLATTLCLAQPAARRGGAPADRPGPPRPRWGLGGGLVYSTPLYANDTASFLPLPFIRYTGPRLRIMGPRAAYLLGRAGRVQVALEASPFFGGYDGGDTHVLRDMADRHATLHAGLQMQVRDLPGGLDLQASVRTDTLNVHGGQEAEIELSRGFFVQRCRLAPAVGLRWRSSDMSNYYYGVRPPEVRPGRQAYNPGHTLSYLFDTRAFYRLDRHWSCMLAIGIELLDQSTRNSPIIDADAELSCILAAIRSL